MPYEQFQNNHNGSEKNIFLVDMKEELHPYYSDILTRGINKVLREKGRIAIIVNKKSYAHGVICNQCGHIPQCKQCEISIAYHQPEEGVNFGMCHICKKTYKPPQNCSQCSSNKIQHYGSGIEQVSERLKTNHNITPLVIKSETANSGTKIKRIRDIIDGYPIVIGTSLLSIPERSDANYDLVIIINADSGLNIPDYEANMNNFHYLYETFTKHNCKNFIVQTRKPEHESIRFACKLDKKTFKERDLQFRTQHNYPPIADLCVIMYKHETEKKVFSTVNKLYQELLYLKEKIEKSSETKDKIEVYATPPLIYKAFNKYRYNIVIKGKGIRKFIDNAFSSLNMTKRGFKLDRQAKEVI